MCKVSILKAIANQVHQLKHILQYSSKQRENTSCFLKLMRYPMKTISLASDCYNLEVTSTTTPSAKNRNLTLQWQIKTN